MKGPKILVVEDDPGLLEGLADNLRAEGFLVETASDGGRGRVLLRREEYDLVILDWMLPVRSGLDLLRDLRASGDTTPVLMLTVRNEIPDRVLGLEVGADDFLGKPFALQELLSRVRALLRRKGWGKKEEIRSFTWGEIHFDLEAFKVRKEGKEASLSPREVEILACLHRRAGRVVTRSEILDQVWGVGVYVGPRTIDTHVLNLRKKIESLGGDPGIIETVHGMGYLMNDPPSSES
ncbi:MAG TPA: response regulator transcription factor [Planctomycetes bacterium]|nr:response regulator transcription factor [Planctomycetota bacterium]